MFARATAFFAVCLVSSSAFANSELHSHLFMNEAMTWAFVGDFEGPLRAKDWQARLSSQANTEAVQRSGLKILVVSLYAHPLFRLDMRDGVRDQIAIAERFVATTPGWIIAHSPVEAERALKANQSVLVLSLEGALGVIETDADIDEFVVRRGIRIITPLHLTDDRFGGVAFLKAPLTFFNPFGLIRQIFRPLYGDEGVRINDRGLSSQGFALIGKLLDRGVWLDLSHASDRSQEAILPLIEARGQPVLYTHTILRKYHGAERGVSARQLAAVARTQGVLGLMPAADYLNGVPEPSSGCFNRADAFVLQYQALTAVLGPQSVMIGSDTNGGISHLPPNCAAAGAGTPGGHSPVNSVDREGYWNISQSRDLWQWLVGRKAAAFSTPEATVRHFIDAWKRAEAGRKN